MTATVLFQELHLPHGGKLGLLTLNSEKTLNALTLDMVELMLKQLQCWQTNNNIKTVYIQGAGEKAFCAGGDVQAMRLSSLANPGGPCDYAETFFEKEYRLDYLLHNYTKPLVVWGHGIVMGGGLGLLAGCHHKVVTEKTRIAMPEVTIALFPDVGGSYFLNRMPAYCGRFLALTAASINATDALYTGLGDYFIGHHFKQAVMDELLQLDLAGDISVNNQKIAAVLNSFQLQSSDEKPEANLQPHQAVIDELCAADDVLAIASRIDQLLTEDPWLLRAQKAFRAGSPLAIKWIFKQLQISRDLDLKAVFNSELILATNIMRHTEFAEGVRALLVDKDQSPQWQFNNLAEVDDALLERFFIQPWEINPLAGL